jgi:ABC-2 type transport system ATP-binding protein
MSGNAIVAEELTYSYGDLLAVDHIDFNVGQGEILGFLGPNGAGKSTTVKMLTGQLRPQSGWATLLDINVAQKPKDVQAKIGVCFERTNLYEQMNGRENLVLFARLFGISNFEPDALLKRVGLDGRGKDKVGTYSKGMKQRLMVARSLVNQPQILFLDEPTEGLDPTSADNIRHIILAERERGAAVFLTTHDMLEADRICDRVAFINQGKIAALDTPHNLKQKHGKRLLIAQVADENGDLQSREIILDSPETPADVQALFENERVITIHSEEASLEDIFIELTGRGLTG